MQDAFVGTWSLNPGKSEFDVHHRPSEATIVFEIGVEGGYLMTAEGAKANGERVRERPQRFMPDGKQYPVPELPGLTAVATRPEANMLRAEVRRDDGTMAGQAEYVVSADGRSLTATNSGFDSQLRQFQQRTVWERCDEQAD
jgi:hypothetical protein